MSFEASTWSMLADAVLLLHFGVVLFVIGGLALIVIGNRLGWPWVNRPALRLAHAAAIATVIAQAWLGVVCPLTTLESWLRIQGGGERYEAGFIEHWIHRLMFFSAPAWVFTMLYTAFGLLVAAVWWRYPLQRRSTLSHR